VTIGEDHAILQTSSTDNAMTNADIKRHAIENIAIVIVIVGVDYCMNGLLWQSILTLLK
jgi:hypothetical protein